MRECSTGQPTLHLKLAAQAPHGHHASSPPPAPRRRPRRRRLTRPPVHRARVHPNPPLPGLPPHPHRPPLPDYPVYMKAGTPSPTGFVMNMQPSEAEVDFDLCLRPTEDTEQIIRRINEEWAPAHQNFTYQPMKKGPTRDVAGRPIFTPTNASNPWWSVFEQAIISAGEKLAKPEILSSTTDSRFVSQMGIPALGFSPMTSTPILLHDNNEFLEDKVFLRGIEIAEFIYVGNGSDCNLQLFEAV